MSFLRKSNYKQRQKTFSTAYRNNMETFYVVHKHPLMCKNKTFARRTVFAPLIIRASMTLEATMLLPVFLFLMLNLYLVIDMLHLQAITNWYLRQMGDKIGAYGHLTEVVLDGDEQDAVLNAALDMGTVYLYVRDGIQKEIDFPDKVYVTTASILEEGEVELVLTYNYPLLGAIGRTKEVWLQSSYFGHAWGSPKGVEDTSSAYITSNGEVYHLYLDCSHLNLSIMELPKEQWMAFREIQEKELFSCKICESESDSPVVYITLEQGRVHYSKDCAGLKRNIVIKELDWARNRYALCQRCKERK